jgi:hypothetical protein
MKNNVVRLTESDLVKLVNRVLSESILGNQMMENLASRLQEKYPSIKYEEGTEYFDPYVYVPLDEEKKTGLLIEINQDDNFEIYFDNGIEDTLWTGWRRDVGSLNSVKHVIRVIDLYLERYNRRKKRRSF